MLSWVIAVATMTLGNFVALLQEDLKRLLAYSSIAHAGYLMIGVTVAFANGRHGTAALPRRRGDPLLPGGLRADDPGGLRGDHRPADRGPPGRGGPAARRAWAGPSPGWRGAMAICLLSLSGIPPLLGFWAKFEIFTSALAAQGLDDSWSFLVLAILGVLNAAVGAYYYLRIVVLMYLYPAKEELRFRGGWPVAASVAACAGLTVVLGLFWAPVPRRPARPPAPRPPIPPRPARPSRMSPTRGLEMRTIRGYGVQRCPHLRRTRRSRHWIITRSALSHAAPPVDPELLPSNRASRAMILPE